MTDSLAKLDRWRIRVTAADTWACDEDGAARMVPLGSEIDIVAVSVWSAADDSRSKWVVSAGEAGCTKAEMQRMRWDDLD